MNTTDRVPFDEVPSFYHGFVALAKGTDLLQALRKASDRSWDTVYRIPTGFAEHRYAEGKWSIKEVFQHVIDAERIFCYRALRFARNDGTELPGFDENAYVANAGTDRREFHELLREHDVVRTGSIALFRGFSPEMLTRTGIANGHRISVRAIGWVIAGHATHHMDVIDERYLGAGG